MMGNIMVLKEAERRKYRRVKREEGDRNEIWKLKLKEDRK